jgi:hypothetical protein
MCWFGRNKGTSWVPNVIYKRTLHFSRHFRVTSALHSTCQYECQFDSFEETRVALAIEAFEKGQKSSLRAAAITLGALVDLTHKRYNGRVPRAQRTPNGWKLTNTEETAIEQWIISLDRRGFSPNLNMVADIANLLLAQRNPPTTRNLASIGKC